jgi:hypothetical protein
MKRYELFLKMKDTKLLVVSKKNLQRVDPPYFLISKCVS